MLKMKKGCTVPFPEKVSEAYEVEGNSIIANIDAEKIKKILQHFIAMHDEPQFFILELPTNFNNENIENGNIKQFHKDIYYIDGCTREEALTILIRVGDLLINDGLCSFGFGCHESGDEIMFGKYNVTTVFSRNIEKYESFFTEHDIPKTDNLITAWDTFSEDYPGSSEKYELNGETVFDIPERFKDWGMYFAERREEN